MTREELGIPMPSERKQQEASAEVNPTPTSATSVNAVPTQPAVSQCAVTATLSLSAEDEQSANPTRSDDAVAVVEVVPVTVPVEGKQRSDPTNHGAFTVDGVGTVFNANKTIVTRDGDILLNDKAAIDTIIHTMRRMYDAQP